MNARAELCKLSTTFSILARECIRDAIEARPDDREAFMLHLGEAEAFVVAARGALSMAKGLPL